MNTAQKDIKKALEASELRYRRLFETAQDGVLLLNFDTGMILDVNPFLIKMLGFSKEEFLNKYLWEVGVFKDVAASKENFKTLQTKRFVRFEDLPLETKSGEKIDVEFVANAYQVDDSTIIQCNIRDITTRKLAETQIKEKEESVQRLAAIIEYSEDAILGKDLNGNILSWNKGAENLYGYTSKEAVGKNISLIIPEDRKTEMTDILDKIKKGEKPARFETIRVKKDGTKIDILLTTSPIKNERGEIIGVSAIAYDISDRKELEKKLRERIEETEKMNKLMVGRELKMIELKKKIEEFENNRSE